MWKIATLVLIVAAAFSFAEEGVAHVWKSVSGDEMTAEFVGIKDGKVLLKSESGMLSPQMSYLAPESRELATKLAAEAEKKAKDAEALRRSTLTAAQKASEIDPLNYFTPRDAVYGPIVTKEYDAYFVEPNCRLFVFVKEDGAFKSEPIRIMPDMYYDNVKSATQRYVRREIKEVTGEPQFNPKDGTFRVGRLHDDDVASEVFYSCKPNEIKAGYRVTDPAKIEFETKHRLIATLSKTYLQTDAEDGMTKIHHSPRLPPEGADYAKVLSAVEGWKVNFRTDVKDERTTFAYNKIAERMPSRASSATLSGGVYGRNGVTFSVASAGTIWPWIYPSTCPMDGYTLAFAKNPGKTAPDLPAAMLKIEIKL
ncbi:MAG: hypothetical protein FWG05_02000 [Kiritimatiellaeota bacterium]|nr:hypothetical protein [Kiritimatiellota bacterium]